MTSPAGPQALPQPAAAGSADQAKPAAGSPQQEGPAGGKPSPAAAAAAAAGAPHAGSPSRQQQQQQQQQQKLSPNVKAAEGGAASAEEAARRQKRREAWEREQEAQRRWDLQRRLADISTDVEFLAREVERVRAELEVPLPPLSELPEAERAALEVARKKRLNELLQSHCKKALGHITSHKWSWPFNAPVDLKQYPDYAETIKKPMDFGTIKRRIDQGGYRHPDDFLADVRLVFDNARLYNKPGSDVHVMANTLQERFEERYSATVSARVAEEAALTRHQQEEARRRHAEVGARGSTEALEQYCSVLVRYIDEVQACVLDARSAAAALCKPVPRAEKEALARALGALPQDAFELAVGLVMAHHPGLQPYDDFGFDLDALGALTLRQMQSFVRACEAAEEEARQRGAGGEGGRPTIAWPQLMLGAGLRPYCPPAARRQRRQAAAAAGGQVQVKQEQPEEPQAAAPQQRQQGAQAAAGSGQKQQQQQAPAVGQKRAAPEAPASTLTPEEVAAAVAAASMMSPLPLPPLPLPPVAGSAVGPRPLAAAASPAASPAVQQPAAKKQKQAAGGRGAGAAAASPTSKPAAKPGAAPFVPTSAQMAAVAAAGPQQHQLLAQMHTLLNQVQMTQAIAKQQVAATAAKVAGKPGGSTAAAQQQQQQHGAGAPGGK